MTVSPTARYLPTQAAAIDRAYDFQSGSHALRKVDPTAEQAAVLVLRKCGRKLRQHTVSDARSRHFTELFLRMDIDRTGSLTIDELDLGLHTLGIGPCRRRRGRVAEEAMGGAGHDGGRKGERRSGRHGKGCALGL